MGYNTRYTFTRHVPTDLDTLIDLLDASTGYGRDVFMGHEPVKWYEHDDDIKRVMLESGVTEVDLHGEGDEQGDVWDKEFRIVDGTVQIKTYTYKLVRPEQPDADD